MSKVRDKIRNPNQFRDRKRRDRKRSVSAPRLPPRPAIIGDNIGRSAVRPKLFNLARMSTLTTGGGPITLDAAVLSFLTFADAGAQDGDEVSYSIEDGNNREVGHGIYTDTPTLSLTRTVLRSTNGNNPINLSGRAQVSLSVSAEDLVQDIYNVDGGAW